MVNVTDCWSKGMRWIFNSGPGNFVFHVVIVNGFHVTTRDSYFYGPIVQGNTQYAYTPHVSGSLLFENNIMHHNVSPMVPNDSTTGSVYAYNFVTDSYYSGPGVILHNVGEMMNLYEGNNTSGYLGDVIHGSHHFGTLFRNLFDGHANNPPANVNTGVQLQTHNRFFNVVGNVIGGTYFTTYEVSQAQNDSAIFALGWQGDASGSVPPNDPDVQRTLMRWGNYDTVNNVVRFVSAEVPSGITNFANAVPGSRTLPASFYLAAKPAAWWGTPWGMPPWPAVGPDVGGGNVSGYGGHANKIPSRLCFENTPVDPAYPNSSPRILLFNAATCYGAGGSAPSPPGPPVVQ